jgi:predicted PurR-regulated permease PerM
MSGQSQLILSMLLIVAGISGLIYSLVILEQCQKIIKKMQRRSKKYIKALDKSIKSYQK